MPDGNKISLAIVCSTQKWKEGKPSGAFKRKNTTKGNKLEVEQYTYFNSLQNAPKLFGFQCMQIKNIRNCVINDYSRTVS